MFSAKKSLLFLAALGMLFFSAAPAVADWDEGDMYKMHFPQLPDRYGWDVAWSNTWLGDDWVCTQDGPVSDIHLWVSFHHWSEQFPPTSLVPIQVQIWSNNPGQTGGYSMPDKMLWAGRFDPAPPTGYLPNTYTIRHYGSGLQGWLPYPETIEPEPNDHTEFFQINIENILDPWIQRKDTVYWLVTKFESMYPQAGWKTADLNRYPPGWTGEHFMDDAVRGQGTTMITWTPIEIYGISRDLAFVITPEPGTLALLATAGLGLLLFAWRRRK